MATDAPRDWIAGLEILGMRFGLERMNALLEALGHPERSAPALHIVGTNGKSSTARLAAGVLSSQGRRVGTYLSPHVTDWTERIQVDGEPIGEAGFTAAIAAVRAAGDALEMPEGDAVTQFEALTAAAFWAFRAAGVDALVIEAGLGGRYDATNVLQPGAVVALTNIALEHTELLGDTEDASRPEARGVRRRLGREWWAIGPRRAPGRRRRVRAPRPAAPRLRGGAVGARGPRGGGRRHSAGALHRPAARPERRIPTRQPGRGHRRRRDGPRRAARGDRPAAGDRGGPRARPPRAVPRRAARGAGRRAQPGGHGRDGRGPAVGDRRATPGLAVVSVLATRTPPRWSRPSAGWSTTSSPPAPATRARSRPTTSRRSPVRPGSSALRRCPIRAALAAASPNRPVPRASRRGVRFPVPAADLRPQIPQGKGTPPLDSRAPWGNAPTEAN